MESLKGAFS